MDILQEIYFDYIMTLTIPNLDSAVKTLVTKKVNFPEKI